jgi:hypothetical protein
VIHSEGNSFTFFSFHRQRLACRRRPPPLDTPGVSSGVGVSQVPQLVLIEARPEEARAEGPDEAVIRKNPLTADCGCES